MTRLITSIRVDHGPGHDHCHVFVQGALTGMLVVDTGKGHALAAEMLGVTVEAFRAVARVHDGRSFQVFAVDLVPTVADRHDATMDALKRMSPDDRRAFVQGFNALDPAGLRGKGQP